MFKDFPDVVSVKMLSKMLGVGRSTAYALLRNKTIRCKRIGKKYLIRKCEVQRFLLENVDDYEIQTWYNSCTISVLPEEEEN